MLRRSPFSFAFIGAALLAGSLFAARASNSAKVGGTAPGGASAWRLIEPIQYENLLIFPVVSSKSADTAGFATLDEALGSGQALVTEGGVNVIRRSRDGRPVAIPQQQGASVNQLVLINRGTKPLVLLAGEMVSGGKQDRIISKDRIVPPGAEPIPLDVFCVEQSRWVGGAQFSAGNIMVHPSVREKAAVDQEQTKVWAAVRNGTTSDTAVVPGGGGGSGDGRALLMVSPSVISGVVATEAQTGAYQKIYKSRRVNSAVEPFVEEVQRRFARRVA